ncbi:MAG: glutamate--tRNA ligase [Candidatus Paceibacterota bacterium]
MTDSPKKEVRVRLAPSPTGPLHLGTARTALFNWLFAKSREGKFILRIENTDIERSEAKYERDIVKGLKWLGLDWDEGPDCGGEYGPYRQSERGDIYEKYLKKLLEENKAYYCFCTKEELESDRQAMLAQGLPPKYSGKCRNLPKEEATKGSVIRFKMPETEIEFNDIIRGKVKFNSALIGDFVIAKDLRTPLFNFAVVIDDSEMKISHIIRGEDHLSNTPKQILIQRAFGFEEPKYAHLPLILAPDRSKLSKRYIENSLSDYKDEGYLADALVNFLAFLGWHPEDDREIFSREELVKEFSLRRVQKAGAVFNIEKLEWLNGQYINKSEPADLVKALKELIPSEWNENKKLLLKIVAVEKERMKKLIDFRELADFFFKLPDYDVQLLSWQGIATEKIITNLELLIGTLKEIPEEDFSKTELENKIMPLTEVWGKGELLWPLRVALSGKQASPGPFEIMEILGKEETLKRIKLAIKKLSD